MRDRFGIDAGRIVVAGSNLSEVIAWVWLAQCSLRWVRATGTTWTGTTGRIGGWWE